MTEGPYTKVATVIAALGIVVACIIAAAENGWWPFDAQRSPVYPEEVPRQTETISRVVVRTGSDCQTSDDQGRCWVGVWPVPVQNTPPQVVRVKHGTQLAVHCYREGETISNGAVGSDGKPIPNVTYSNIWFWVTTPDGKRGYIPKVWTGSVLGPRSTKRARSENLAHKWYCYSSGNVFELSSWVLSRLTDECPP